MTTQTITSASWRDYLEICKPRVVLLMLLCAWVGMYLAAAGSVSVATIVMASVGIALVAGSAAAVNHIADARIDAQMARTQERPVVSGRLSTFRAGVFAAVTGSIGFLVLWFGVNPLTALLNLASWIGYGLIYTLYLKRATPQNIVIGGLFGAAPPLFGWTAVTNSVDPGGLLLVLIIFVWTPPHFWALALDRKEEYAQADLPMLPVTHGEAYTRLHILLYTILLFVCSILPFTIGMAGPLYVLAAVALGTGFLYWAIVLIRNRNEHAPKETFKYSIFYLALLFLALVVDHHFFVITEPAISPLKFDPIQF